MDAQKIVTFLTFDSQAKEAVDLYTSIFANSRIVSSTHHGEGGPGPAGSLMSVSFELEGQEFRALNGGPSFRFAQGISLFVNCDTQDEINELWEKLSEGGQKGPCGWLTDRFGVSWQIVPRALAEMLSDDEPERSKCVLNAMLQMGKLELATLQEAYESA